MSELKNKISDDIKTAMKSQDKKKLQVLRMVLSEIKYQETISGKKEDIDEENCLKVVSSYQKKLQKSLGDYPDGEKKNEILEEIKIVDGYLPKKASPEMIENAIKQVLSETQDRNFGQLMKLITAKLGQNADGKMISAELKKLLG